MASMNWSFVHYYDIIIIIKSKRRDYHENEKASCILLHSNNIRVQPIVKNERRTKTIRTKEYSNFENKKDQEGPETNANKSYKMALTHSLYYFMWN